MNPKVGHEIATGILVLKHDAEDDFRRAGNVFLEVVEVIVGQREFSAVDNHVEGINTLLVVALVLGIGEEGIMVQIELGQLHIGCVLVHLS